MRAQGRSAPADQTMWNITTSSSHGYGTWPGGPFPKSSRPCSCLSASSTPRYGHWAHGRHLRRPGLELPGAGAPHLASRAAARCAPDRHPGAHGGDPVLALASGNSLFVYFLQPSLATALLGGAFLLSVPLGRPLAEKLAHDFVPLPAWFVSRPRVRKLFVRISLLWALVSLVNAAGTIALLVNVPITTYLAAKTGLSAFLTLGGIVVSSWWFRRGIRHPEPLPVAAAAAV